MCGTVWGICSRRAAQEQHGDRCWLWGWVRSVQVNLWHLLPSSISFIPRCIQMVTEWKPPFPSAYIVIKPKSCWCETCIMSYSLLVKESTVYVDIQPELSVTSVSCGKARDAQINLWHKHRCQPSTVVHRKVQTCISLFSGYNNGYQKGEVQNYQVL